VSDYFERVERQLVARIDQITAGTAAATAATDRASRRRARRRRAMAWIVPLGAIAVVAVVVAVIVISGGGARRTSTPGSSSPIYATLHLHAPASTSATALAHAATTLRARLQLAHIHATVTVQGTTIAIAGVPVRDGTLVAELAVPGQLRVYDWEANVLLPSGRTVASQLLGRHNGPALQLSQGVNGTAPGGPAAGATTLYRAVQLAARQPARGSASSQGTLYRFGLAGSAACAALAKIDGAADARAVTAGAHCLLAGPAANAAALRAQLPAGVGPDAGRTLRVKGGTVVLEAQTDDADPTPIASSAARFYVLRDRPALTGSGLTDVRAGTDAGGQPDVTFGFTAAGARAFQSVTAAVAHRGATVSLGATQYDQHFAIALDGRLISVPSIDYKQYPDGVVQQAGAGGSEIVGAFTRQTAARLAAILRTGTLPATLTPAAGG
jgi:hypothetical protein